MLCAWGDATTLLRHEVTATLIKVVSKTSIEELTAAFDELVAKASDVMLSEQGVSKEQQVYKYQADLRYVGQAIAMPVDMTSEDLKKKGVDGVKELFEAAHEQRFTYRLPNDVEIMNLRIVVEEVRPDITIKQLAKASSSSPPEAAIASKTLLVHDGKEYKDSPIWERSQLECGHVVEGPCVITEMDSNTVILPGFKGEIDHVGNILIWEIESGNTTADVAVESDKVDPVSVDIIENALGNARNEMDTLVTSASMSPGIREQQDEFNVIAEPGGKMIAGQFGSFIGGFLESWKDTIDEGDIFITNDPYSVGGAISHLNDWLVLMPIHSNGKLSKNFQVSLFLQYSTNWNGSCLDRQLWTHDGWWW